MFVTRYLGTRISGSCRAKFQPESRLNSEWFKENRDRILFDSDAITYLASKISRLTCTRESQEQAERAMNYAKLCLAYELRAMGKDDGFASRETENFKTRTRYLLSTKLMLKSVGIKTLISRWYAHERRRSLKSSRGKSWKTEHDTPAFKVPQELQYLWPGYELLIFPSALVFVPKSNDRTASGKPSCVIPAQMLDLFESATMGSIHGHLLYAREGTARMEQCYLEVLELIAEYSIHGANKVAHASKALFASYAASFFEKNENGEIHSGLSLWNLTYGSEVRQEAISRCKLREGKRFVEDLEGRMNRWQLTEVEKLEMMGATSIIPSQPTSVSSLMERSEQMHLKVTAPDSDTYADFLEFAGRSDLFWYLRKHKNIREDQLDASLESKALIMKLVKKIEEDNYAVNSRTSHGNFLIQLTN